MRAARWTTLLQQGPLVEREKGVMSSKPQAPAPLASEDVIISAPMSHAGSAQRIMRLRRRGHTQRTLAAITTLAIVLVLMVWVLVTAWYLTWGLLLVPYRLLRRGARKRKAEMLRHRELLGTIQGSAAGSTAAIVTATTRELSAAAETATVHSPAERVADSDRESAIEQLRQDMLAGRLTGAEFEDRLETLHKAKTWGDLEAIRADLPISSSPASG
jgi:DUF1707 SHOCT-like domain